LKTHETQQHESDDANLPTVVNVHQVAQLNAARPDLTILDVRTPAEFESAHIPGSYNVPLDLLSEHTTQIASAAGGPVVLVCQSGMRARQAEQALIRTDIPRLHVMEGGIGAWDRSGLPLNRGQERWGIERQVRGVAGLLVLLGALGGMFVRRPIGGLAAAVGGGLAFSAVTNSCGMAMLLAKLPYNRGATCDIREVLDRLAQDTGSPRVSIQQPSSASA
jgi:rhodanese-related sulfurtransferase